MTDKQYGFRPKSNTLTATVDLVTKIKTNIDDKKIALGVFIDLKKAFDTVSHTLLLQKLNNIGIIDSAHRMFESYLSNRTQIVKIDKAQSSPQTITFGVPQGSILGPLMFIIYINGINNLGLSGNLTLYADDTCLFYFGSSMDYIISKAQRDLDILVKWFKDNLLTINTSKTCYVVFSAKNKVISNHSKLTINGEAIHKTTNEKYLGLCLDSGLTWKTHIQHIMPKLSSLTGALRKCVSCLPREVRYTIYNSLVKPHLDYLIEVWGSAAPTNLCDLQITQNKLIKVLFSYDYLTPTEKIYKETKILNIKQLYIYNTCILIRKILNKEIHTQITFSRNSEHQRIKLRNSNNLRLPCPRTNYGKRNILYEGAQYYNKLPKTIRDTASQQLFKMKLKPYICDKYF